MIYSCCDENRRSLVAEHDTLNGIDWLEVLDRDAPLGSPRQQTLMLKLIKEVPAGLTWENVRIESDEGASKIQVSWAAPATAPPAAPRTIQSERDFFDNLDPEKAKFILLVRTDGNGDYSDYLLRLVRGVSDARPPENFDPRLSELKFSFKVECASEFDCRERRNCPPATETFPDINYLAKDYASFRRLMLDRLGQLLPDWRERSAADLGVTLTELLAYTADHLSYWQDAVATEAYLETARRRTSLRRHALLVDYVMHDGCNARAWLHVSVAGGPVSLQKNGTRFLTHVSGAAERIAPDSRAERDAMLQSPTVFEAMHDATLHEEHTRLEFYTWGDERCCLPKGATHATLSGHYPKLQAGEVLLFLEVRGPLSDHEEDADPSHRHAVRLTGVQAFEGEQQLADPLDKNQLITEITWHTDDALPFPLCISSLAAGDKPVSIAMGNIILVDHGLTVSEESLGAVPEPSQYYPAENDVEHCAEEQAKAVPPRYRPRLAQMPLTRYGTVLKHTLENGTRKSIRLAYDADAAASHAMAWKMTDVIPHIGLHVKDRPEEPWEARRDLLLDSVANNRHFVVESEHDGSNTLRFGDDRHGKRPDSGDEFIASYRVGNGITGNVGAHAIAHVVSDNAAILAVTNPMAARGGTQAETAAQVRRRAPQAFRVQERAVTPDDYAEVTERMGGIQQATAKLRWTGSWHSVFITVDQQGGESLNRDSKQTLHDHVNRYRMAGHDLRFKDPLFVSLEIDMQICVAPQYFRANVRQALLEIFSNGMLADGRRGVFHPDNFSFGQTIYLSPLYASARQAAGVESVRITRFHRLGREDPKPLADGFMTLNDLEIARLDNDPSYPDNGVLRLKLFGGK